LKFVVFTDHGDATRTPDRPVYRSGVLCLDGVEISTSGGHLVVLDMPAAPYPLGGEARDVVEDVHRLGGFGIVAHPDSPKPELQWRDWNIPVDAVEMLNPDSSWRLWAAQPGWSAKRRLAIGVLDYPLRPAETMASLLQPSLADAEWASAAAHRRVVAIAGLDAHAKLPLLNGDSSNSRFSLPLPSYEAQFRTISVRVRPDRQFSGDAEADAAALIGAIRSGHLFVGIDALASPPSIAITAANSLGTVQQGDELRSGGGPISLHVRSNAPPEFTTSVRNGLDLISADHHEQDFTVTLPDGPAVYWAEILAAGNKRQGSWIRSNAIYVRAAQAPARPSAPAAPVDSVSLFDRSTTGWHVEHDSASLAAVESGATLAGPALRLRWALAPGTPQGKFIALARQISTSVPNDRLSFTAHAEHPMRISVQFRTDDPSGAVVERWQRSVFVDVVDQERTVYFDDLKPVGQTATALPVFANVHTILFTIDATNTKPGSSGRLWIGKVALQR
jgi:hypothetical protein